MDDVPEDGGRKAVDRKELETLPDDALRDVVKWGQEILSAREEEQRREGMREIQRIAKQLGIKVDIGEKHRRGRPPKKEGPKL